jgi:hypothetical protein
MKPPAMELKTHPNLIAFQKTATKSFPLMLVVGREPNESIPVSPTLGTYDFRTSPTAAFWNMAYRLLARSDQNPDFGIRELKALCVEKQSSPIIIADALPITRLYGAGLPIPKVEDGELKAHVNSVLGHKEVISRVRIAFLSGHKHEPYKTASDLFKKGLDDRSIRWLDTSFFALHHSRLIESEVEKSEWAWDVLRGILSEFRNA